MNFKIIGGPLAGQMRAGISKQEAKSFTGGLYRFVEADFWGFSCPAADRMVYVWYEGGKRNPEYWDDAHRYGWHSRFITDLAFECLAVLQLWKRVTGRLAMS